jgi:hypothetical protein
MGMHIRRVLITLLACAGMHAGAAASEFATRYAAWQGGQAA